MKQSFWVLFYVPNIIDYVRVLFLYWSICSVSTTHFAFWYLTSCLLDAVDGPAARKLGQESTLGYYLDIVIDRISSCSCICLAAQAVLADKTFIPVSYQWPTAMFLYVCLMLVEIISHASVLIVASVTNTHQKELGMGLWIIRAYLGSKPCLFWACLSYEVLLVGLIMNIPTVVIVCLPGFLFRAVAVSCRFAHVLWHCAQPTRHKKL